MSENIRKITKNGAGTYYVSIPKEFMSRLKWKERQKIIVKLTSKGIIIRDWQKK